MSLKTIEDFNLENQQVFIRTDLNVPIKDGKVADPHRIIKALPTIRYALDKKAKVILASHLGRPEGEEPRLSLSPVAAFLSEVLDVDVFFEEKLLSDVPSVVSHSLKQNQIILLENLRFHQGEVDNDKLFASELSKNIDIYINDAFGVCHRKHASLSALPQRIEKKGIGYLIQKEMEQLDRIRMNPESPFVLVLGGSKVKDKFQLILNLIDQADHLVIGGELAYVFLKALGHKLGKTRIEFEFISLAKDLIQRIKMRKKHLYLPVDHVASPVPQKENLSYESSGPNLKEDSYALDIGPKTRLIFSNVFKKAKTIFWNGPMGMFELPAYSKGTYEIAKSIGGEHQAFRVAGGGDSARAASQFSLEESFDHISTGGGASLCYIQGLSLPALKALEEKKG